MGVGLRGRADVMMIWFQSADLAPGQLNLLYAVQ